MSASSKKKQRSQADASKMTERQLAEQKEARQIRLYTILFVIALAVMVVTAVSVGVTKTISASGVREKNTVAMSIGGNNLSRAELLLYGHCQQFLFSERRLCIHLWFGCQQASGSADCRPGNR